MSLNEGIGILYGRICEYISVNVNSLHSDGHMCPLVTQLATSNLMYLLCRPTYFTRFPNQISKQ